MSGLSENQIIELLQEHGVVQRPDVVLGIGDDGAILQPPEGQQIVQVVDAVHEGVHFPKGMRGKDVAWRAFAVNISDIAAMGALPAWATLVLSMPVADESWIRSFAQGLRDITSQFNIALVGGDTVRGPLGVAVQITGFVEPGMALRRKGAAVGDGIYITGRTGMAAAGLACMQGKISLQDEPPEWRHRFLKPVPRLQQGRELRGIASACLDISDGLLRDLGRLLEASGVGATLEAPKIPGLDELIRKVGETRALALALTGGDDYELCFTVPREHQARLGELRRAWSCECTLIGEISGTPGIRLVKNGREIPLPPAGFEHF